MPLTTQTHKDLSSTRVRLDTRRHEVKNGEFTDDMSDSDLEDEATKITFVIAAIDSILRNAR